MAQISNGFKDFDKNKPVFNLELSPDEMYLVAKLLSHVRLGMDSPESKAALSILEALETSEIDIFSQAENSILSVTAEDGMGMVIATIGNDSATFDFEEI